MSRRVIGCVAAFAVLSQVPAGAQENITPAEMMARLNSMQTAREAGQIIATADACGYTLNPEKVSTFMRDTLAEMDQSARMVFQSAAGAQKIRMGEMSEIERTGACALQAKLAKKMGLMN
ncbi:hypothetical protein [Shinella fusca]|uniref:Uncharacterized protein n=1 Tax=Shinella fusca TaxID=544480 RepID=A0A7W7YTE0_9HYPH|nr:hypothetical protein [Shinella fusca]MBB5041911.1 hypothetical protein [Shinella fusca]